MVRFLQAAQDARSSTVCIMPAIDQPRLYASIRVPSSKALEFLAPHSGRMLSMWRREVRSLGLKPDDLLPATKYSFIQLAKVLRNTEYPVFQRWLERFGESLTKQGVQLLNAVSAYNRLFAIALSSLIGSVPQRAALSLALVPYPANKARRKGNRAGAPRRFATFMKAQARLAVGLAGLHSLVTELLLTGSTGRWPPGNNGLVKDDVTAGQTRRGEMSHVLGLYEQERRRLSRDLHDQIGHDLVLIKLYLEMIAMEHNQNKPENVQPRIVEAIALVSQAIDSVRRLVFDLGPALFDDLGFLPAMQSYAGQFSARTKIRVTLQAGRLPENIPMTHQVALYRLLQGALSNVLKHASARNVRVSLKSRNQSMIMMVIEDDGVGFDTRARESSFGLTAMRERVEALGGKFEVESKPAGPIARRHGTTIKVGLPLPKKEKKREPRRAEKNFRTCV
jgi:signal transduction histidine kinase